MAIFNLIRDAAQRILLDYIISWTLRLIVTSRETKEESQFRVTAIRVHDVISVASTQVSVPTGRCIRCSCPSDVVQPIEPLNGFTIDSPFDSLLGRIEKMVASHRRSHGAAGRPN